MRIVVDGKNQALYGGGISHWVSDILPSLIFSFPEDEFLILSPKIDSAKSNPVEGLKIFNTYWPKNLPRFLRNPVYDNIIFPGALRKSGADLIFTPYYDVRMNPKIPSIITIHDLCYLDVAECYPWRIRAYYLFMLKWNLRKAKYVLTVSESTKSRLMEVFSLSTDQIGVVPNSIPSEFLEAKFSDIDCTNWRVFNIPNFSNEKLILYSGGLEYRKNINRFFQAAKILWDQGHEFKILITGNYDFRWSKCLKEINFYERNIHFLGRLSVNDLALGYASVDAVVYPSLCEGFGRACIEAMAMGTPIACSDIDVFREVGGDYPLYFDPFNINMMAQVISKAFHSNKKERYVDLRFTGKSVKQKFIDVITPIIDEIRRSKLQ